LGREDFVRKLIKYFHMGSTLLGTINFHLSVP
jgi:hypothetical protein